MGSVGVDTLVPGTLLALMLLPVLGQPPPGVTLSPVTPPLQCVMPDGFILGRSRKLSCMSPGGTLNYMVWRGITHFTVSTALLNSNLKDTIKCVKKIVQGKKGLGAW